MIQPQNPDPENRKRGSIGFSLIELLVVVAIIAILAAMLLPSLRSARERGKQITCLSNMRQVGVALHMYLDGNDDHLPVLTTRDWWESGWWFKPSAPWESWETLIHPYLNPSHPPEAYQEDAVMVCPVDDVPRSGGRARRSYTINREASGGYPNYLGQYNKSRSLRDIEDMTGTAVFAERAHIDDHVYTITASGKNLIFDPHPAFGLSPVGMHHLGGTNLEFMDGHGEFLIADKITMSLGTPEHD